MTSPENPYPPNFPPDWACAWGYDDKSPYPFATLSLSEQVTVRMRWIPPGEFMMGSPQDENGRKEWDGLQHLVVLSSGLWLAETPCTQAAWMAVMGRNPNHFTGDEHRPVEQVSWDDCQEFCHKLNARFPELGSRLPSEAEWEHACRAGTTGAFNDGSNCTDPTGEDPALVKLAWFDKNSGIETHPVGQLKPNAWGLFDMHGNVWEWCQDHWADQYDAQEQRDPTGPADGTYRVIRGGCWGSHARFCRSAYRNWRHPTERFQSLGLRLAAGQ